jgi:hypothetical protein
MAINEAVRLARYVEPSNSRMTDNYVELKRTDGSATVLRIVWRMLPRNGGRALLLVCSYCTRRAVTLWLGVGQLFRMVEQGQADQLAMPLLRSAALLFRRWLSVPRHPISRFRKPTAATVVASLRVHLT